MGAFSFNSYKINERPIAPKRIRAAVRFDHEPDRDLLAAAGISRRPDDAVADRCGVALAAAPAGGCLSGSVASHRRDHHSMAGARRGGSRTADHGARGNRDEWHPSDDHASLDFAVWI